MVFVIFLYPVSVHVFSPRPIQRVFVHLAVFTLVNGDSVKIEVFPFGLKLSFL